MPLTLLILALLAPATRPGVQSSNERLAEARAALAAEGVALTQEAFAAARPEVADERNPAIEIVEAAEPLSAATAKAWGAYQFGHNARPPKFGDEPAPPRGHTPDEVILAADAEMRHVWPVLDGLDGKVRPAVDEVRADFGIDWTVGDNTINVLLPRLNLGLPHLTSSRDVANALKLRAYALTITGEHDAVPTTIRRTLGVADAADTGHPSLVGHLVGIGVDALAGDVAARVAPHLDVGEGGADPAELRGLIDLLLDDTPRRDGWRAAMEWEAMSQQRMIDVLLNAGPMGEKDVARLPLRLVYKAIVRGDGAELARLTLAYLEAAEAEDFPATADARATLDRFEERILEQFEWRNPVSRVMHPSLDGVLKAYYLTRNARRLAAVSLAVRLYRHDHGDALPPTLDALVPEYLPAVPQDAMTADAPVRYDPDRGVAWTVGLDREDHGGVSMDDRLRADPEATPREIRDAGYDEVVRLR